MTFFRVWLPLLWAILAGVGAAALGCAPCWLQPACQRDRRSFRGSLESEPILRRFLSAFAHNSPRDIRALTRAAASDCTRPCWLVRPIIHWYSLTCPAARCSAAICSFIASISRSKAALSLSFFAFAKSLLMSSTVLMTSSMRHVRQSVNGTFPLVRSAQNA